MRMELSWPTRCLWSTCQFGVDNLPSVVSLVASDAVGCLDVVCSSGAGVGIVAVVVVETGNPSGHSNNYSGHLSHSNCSRFHLYLNTFVAAAAAGVVVVAGCDDVKYLGRPNLLAKCALRWWSCY